VQADPPPFVVLPAPVEETIAAGEEPGWTLFRGEGFLILRRTGLPELRATAEGPRDTPRGRSLTAVVDGRSGLRLTLRRQPGLCRTVRFGESSGFVTLDLPDGTRLSGCAAPDWEG
jgi:uncharacterized membrane protein